MRLTKMVLFAAVAVVAGMGVGTAEASLSQCDNDRVCLWGNNDFLFLLAERDDGLSLANLTGEANNEMDSWANKSDRNAAGYGSANGGGDCQQFGAFRQDNNVAFFNSDEVSSWRTNDGC